MKDKQPLKIISDMTKFLSSTKAKSCKVILNGSPVISFGNFQKSKLATLGLNPSDQEFHSKSGVELDGVDRRFHTLKSLGLSNWQGISHDDLKKIMFTCENYFQINPYDRWFKPLNYLISGTGYSYYDMFDSACHLDLVPYATSIKWGNLPENNKRQLLEVGATSLANIISVSEIEILIVNGRSVVKTLESLSDERFREKEISSWKLPRKKDHVRGLSYTATLHKIGNSELIKPIRVFGFNHNIQSSFGVTNEVKAEIKNWITKIVNTI